MEDKLKEYRAKQEKAKKIKRFQDNAKNIFSFFKWNHKVNLRDEKQSECDNQFENKVLSSRTSHLKKRRNMEIPEEEKNLLSDDVLSIDEEESLSDDSIWCCTGLQLFYYSLCFILWVIIYIIFIKLQFGTVYLISSALIFMYMNTGTTPKKSGEMSAYSVFNKNCESINGTLKAEQFEREIMFGAGSVR